MPAFAHMFDLFPHKFSCLRTWSFSLALIFLRSFERFFLRHPLFIPFW
jgi:hypothetical protein